MYPEFSSLTLYLELNDLLFLSKIINELYLFSWQNYVSFPIRFDKLRSSAISARSIKKKFLKSLLPPSKLNRTVDFCDSENLKANLLKLYCNFLKLELQHSELLRLESAKSLTKLQTLNFLVFFWEQFFLFRC